MPRPPREPVQPSGTTSTLPSTTTNGADPTHRLATIARAAAREARDLDRRVVSTPPSTADTETRS
jgi:hypothetical protein